MLIFRSVLSHVYVYIPTWYREKLAFFDLEKTMDGRIRVEGVQ